MKAKLLTLFMLLSIVFSSAQQNAWSVKQSISKTDGLSKFHLQTDKVILFKLNDNIFKQSILNTPLRGKSSTSNTQITIPGSEGKMETFTLFEAPVFSPQLSALYPNIKSYVGFGQNASRLSMSVSPQGIQTMITYRDKEAVFMMPESHNSNQYILYSKSSRGDFEIDFVCSTIDEFKKENEITESNLSSRDANDQTLRTYRLAVSVNGEYTQYHGGTVAGALAAINATMSRVNAVFETDMAITFALVNAPQLIYTNAATDPYSNNLGNWNGELANTLDNNLADADYDIGHLFGATGGGGNAGCIGCVCEDGTVAAGNHKGSGITSPADGIPETDTFDIDYVAHEIGHQMGANHTWAFAVEGTGVNAEPGSGTTIMGYAGITGANNVQLNSDPYFHYHSINQILNNVATAPNDCAVTTAIANNPPLASAGTDLVIPQGTAYVLRGAATDLDGGDNLTYCWEQIDSGTVTNTSFGPTLTSGSMNRSLPPSNETDRYIPKLSRVIAGQLTQTNPTINQDWETVATVGRTLNWALTVRDREPSTTGLNGQSSFDLTAITVDATSGPFTVTSQTTNENWDAGSSQTVTWDVAGTDAGAVNTPTVNILLSTDGGLTFPLTIASDVPNDGSQDVTVPIGAVSSMVRVIVEGNNNIFYAVNSTNFTIQESEFVVSVSNPILDVCQPNDAVYNFTYNTFLGFSANTNFSVTGLPAGASAVVNPTSASADGTVGTITVSGTGALAVGSYPFTFQGVSGSISKTVDLTLNVYSSNLNPVVLSSPTDNAVDVPADGNLIWVTDSNAINYLVEISIDAGFGVIIESATVQTNTYTTTMLDPFTQYFWRVTASNDCATANASPAFNFTTANITCDNFFTATDTPIIIADSGTNANYMSVITIAENLPIIDVNVKINIQHDWNNDLDIFLISPIGTSVELSTDNGNSGDDDYIDTVFDQEAGTAITAGNSPFTGTFIPEGDLSVLNGEMTAGTWTLSVDDDYGAEDGGTITEFSLDFCVQGSLSVDDITLNSDQFTVYPNPNNGEFTIKLNDSSFDDDLEITVFDIRGRKVYTKSFKNNNEFNQTINLNSVKSGMYLLTITDGKKQATKKLIIK